MSAQQQKLPVEDTLETGGKPRKESNQKPGRESFRKKAERFEFGLLATEDELVEARAEAEEDGNPSLTPIVRLRQSLKPDGHQNLWKRAKAHARTKQDDPYYDLPEDHMKVLEVEGIKQVRVPSLLECQHYLDNPEADAYRRRAFNPFHILTNLFLNIFAAFIIWFINMLSPESCVIVLNAAGAAAYFGDPIRREDWELKLDFSFLAFTVIFPLTFLISSTFARREQALSFLGDFKSSLLSAALMTLSVDWPNGKGDSYNGRLQLPEHFNMQITKEYRELIKLVYEYLSMPQVSHGRNHIFCSKRHATKRVHALQNGIVQDINDYMYDFAIHTEVMKKNGFSIGEASRLHQYHQYIQQRFEHLRQLKYYRTPQATRSFGRVYIIVLPWVTGPYWAWMSVGTTFWFAILSSAFSFLVLFGLLNAQQGLEDPFHADYQSLMPGIDTVKLDYEMAVIIQAIEQYYANAELQRALELQMNTSSEKDLEEDVRMKHLQETEMLDTVAEETRSEQALSDDVGYA